VFLVKSVYFNLWNNLPKSGTFPPGHALYLFRFSIFFEQTCTHHQESQLYQYNIWYMSLCVGDRTVTYTEWHNYTQYNYKYRLLMHIVHWTWCCLHSNQILPKLPAQHEVLSRTPVKVNKHVKNSKPAGCPKFTCRIILLRNYSDIKRERVTIDISAVLMFMMHL